MLPTPIYASEREAAAKLVQKTFQRSKQRKLKVKKKVLDAESSVADAITDYAKNQKADLIVVGTSSVRGLKRFVLGSISSVVNNANTSVLVVR
jgi:nucleotide-binding universal stress UspA family protein